MASDHVHKFFKVNFIGKNGKYSVFKCAIPECTFFINVKLSFGYKVICWRCGDAFIMTLKNSKQKKPHCSNCVKRVEVDTKPYWNGGN